MHRILIPLLGVLVLLSPRALAQEGHPTRLQDDFQALERYRPGWAFWRHIFTIPDGAIAFGSATDGRLLAVFPRSGDWATEGEWTEASLARVLDGVRLPRDLDERRTRVAELLQEIVGPVLHNPTRGNFLLPNIRPYAGFLAEWGRIYERFGVPPEIGLAQAVIESGLSGTRRSEARALGFCQFLESNLRRLNRMVSHVIEGRNQTAQAPYCAAYLSVLATKYGSFIPALSDHHSGGTNVGRVLINGARLGADNVRDQYLRGSSLVRDLRQMDLYGYRDIYRTYGPRSYFYAEMVFGNTLNVRDLLATTPQETIHAMRTTRALPLADIARRTRLSTAELRRYNPALVRQVPARATLFLPTYVKDLGQDVAFWHRPAPASYTALLEEFLDLGATPEQWDDPLFEPVLRAFERRFRATKSEEGDVMATMIRYVMDDAYTGGRGEILAEFRQSDEVRRLFDRAAREREALFGPEGAPCAAVALAAQVDTARRC
jgi:hypothetical protein